MLFAKFRGSIHRAVRSTPPFNGQIQKVSATRIETEQPHFLRTLLPDTFQRRGAKRAPFTGRNPEHLWKNRARTPRGRCPEESSRGGSCAAQRNVEPARALKWGHGADRVSLFLRRRIPRARRSLFLLYRDHKLISAHRERYRLHALARMGDDELRNPAFDLLLHRAAQAARVVLHAVRLL